MDDEYEFDDDLADEDLILALEEASSSTVGLQRLNNATTVNPPSVSFTANSRPRAADVTSRTVPRPSGQQSFRQTTLFGTTAHQEEPPAPSRSNRVFRADLPPEVPTHHVLDHNALKTWVYPTNLGPTRDYQKTIVYKGLFHNTLVALPTGLGKTFIAATVMLNYYRWTTTAKIVFVAPTKPLASQQVEACLNIAGVPRSQATLLTGEISPSLREQEWACKRLFFMTPQTLQNDLSKGYANPKSIVLLVVDEAHRATGDYAYVKVIEFMRRFYSSFRVLALTATPGSKVEGVQEVINNLGISEVEIRTEESIDIRDYVHSRDTERVVMQPSDEILKIGELFSKALQPLCDILSQQNIRNCRDPLELTTFGLMQASREWMESTRSNQNEGLKGMVRAVFSTLLTLAHGVKLLTLHGIKPFRSYILTFRAEAEANGERESKYKRQLLQNASFQEMIDWMDKWHKAVDFLGHPKLNYLQERLLTHFDDAGPGSNTRVIVFCEYRDSAEEIVRMLNMQKPLLSASIFVGQADTKRGGAGMKQRQQIETIEQFKDGKFNVLVATSIGEEGLDIGQVDLIVCYDASASPIRMLQRMGRTGRKRAGSVVLLLMKGKEERKFAQAQDNYETMQRLICDGSRFQFRHDLSSRIVPRDVKPEEDKRHVEIPIENTQDTSLPVPKKSRGKKKASKKIFHMPDGVETGFRTASMFGQPASKEPVSKPKPRKPVETDFLAEVPNLESVLLTPREATELFRLYQDIPNYNSNHEVVVGPRLTTHTKAQRKLRPTVDVEHGELTQRCVQLFRKLGKSQAREDMFDEPYGDTDGSRYHRLPMPSYASDTDGLDDDSPAGPMKSARRLPPAEAPSDGELAPAPKRRRPVPKPGPNPKRKPAPKPRRERGVFSESEASEGASETEEEQRDSLPGSSPPPSRGRTAPKAAKAKARRRNVPSSFEGRGDDCMRTSDNYESDGSDSGGDLEGFIVEDDEVTSSMRREMLTSPTTASLSPPPSLNGRRKGKGKEKGVGEEGTREDPFFVPTHFTLTQGSEESVLPDLSALAGSKRRPSPDAGWESEDDDVASRPNRGKKRRQEFVVDSDTE